MKIPFYGKKIKNNPIICSNSNPFIRELMKLFSLPPNVKSFIIRAQLNQALRIDVELTPDMPTIFPKWKRFDVCLRENNG